MGSGTRKDVPEFAGLSERSGAMGYGNAGREAVGTSDQESGGILSTRREALGGALLCAAMAAGSAAGIASAQEASSSQADGETSAGEGLLTPYADAELVTTQDKADSVKRVLVVVDYQVDFVDGALGTNPLAIALEDAICDKVNEYLDAGEIVCYTMDTHPAETYELTREGHHVSSHCVPGTDGWELYGKVADVLTPEVAHMVKKGTYGSRCLPDYLNFLKAQGQVFSSIELCGVSTSVCVFHNAIMLYNFFPECEIILDASTTAAKDEETTSAALDQLENWGMVVNR